MVGFLVAIGFIVAVIFSGVLWADQSMLYSGGGNKTVSVPAGGATADFVIYGTTPSGTAPNIGLAPVQSKHGGRLCKITIITLGSGVGAIYDSLTASAGAAPLFTIPASAAVGTIYDIEMPFQNGLVTAQTSTSPGFVISFNTDTLGGRS
jgi:hypothetical protein